jgi:hypothetical protein
MHTSSAAAASCSSVNISPTVQSIDAFFLIGEPEEYRPKPSTKSTLAYQI